MYCINCGVKLSDSEKECPLCGTKVFHPDFIQSKEKNTYPKEKYPTPDSHTPGLAIFATACMLLPILIVLACDLRFNKAVTWSGYAIGAILLGYILFILPLWFRKPNPVIFVPCDFAAVGVYLLYINNATSGDWFLSFAFPVVCCVGVIVTAVVTLLHYVHKGKLYIFGGAAVAFGVFMPLMEFLMYITFDFERFIGWSFYPMTGLVLIGALLIFLAICRPAREYMERNFFI